MASIRHSKVLSKKYRYFLDGPEGNIPAFESRYYAQKFIDDLIKEKDWTIIEKGDDGYFYIYWKLPFGVEIEDFPW